TPVSISLRISLSGRTPFMTSPNSGCGCENAHPDDRMGVFGMVGPARFELAAFRPPDGRANQAAPRPDAGHIERTARAAQGPQDGNLDQIATAARFMWRRADFRADRHVGSRNVMGPLIRQMAARLRRHDRQ